MPADKIRTANKPALVPLLIATVATGMPRCRLKPLNHQKRKCRTIMYSPAFELCYVMSLRHLEYFP